MKKELFKDHTDLFREYWVDENENKWNCDYFSAEEAEFASKSLVDCKRNIDSFRCKTSHDNISCIECYDCESNRCISNKSGESFSHFGINIVTLRNEDKDFSYADEIKKKLKSEENHTKVIALFVRSELKRLKSKVNYLSIESKNYWTDYRGNKWDSSYFSKEEAEFASRSLVNCRDCINCYKCEQCVQCISCDGCFGCSWCIGTSNSRDCTAIYYCKNCNDSFCLSDKERIGNGLESIMMDFTKSDHDKRDDKQIRVIVDLIKSDIKRK